MFVKASAIFAGLVVALFAWILAWLQAGAGHGWVAPTSYSLGLFLLYPLVLVRASGTGPVSPWFDVVVLAAAILLDLGLVIGTWRHELEYFMQGIGFPVTWVWIALWLSWQMVAIANLVQRLGPRTASS